MYTRPPIPDAAVGALRAWHPWEPSRGDLTVKEELVDAVLHDADGVAPTEVEKQMRLAELRSLIKAAQRGELGASDWTPVRRQPELWELRLQWGTEMKVRIYFHEPDWPATQTVAALAHVKDIIPGDDDATRRLQNQHMDAAAHRIMFGRADDWGLGWSDPLYPDPQPGLPPSST